MVLIGFICKSIKNRDNEMILESLCPLKVSTTETMKWDLNDFNRQKYQELPKWNVLICKSTKNRGNEAGFESIWLLKVQSSEAMKWVLNQLDPLKH